MSHPVERGEVPMTLDGGEIAVVGLSCRLPGANDPTSFWRNLRDGVCSVRHWSDEALRASGVPKARLAEASYVKAAAFLDDPECFDAAFFDMNPREAEITDPQHRVLLELAQHVLEDAGHTAEHFPGRIGVFAGATLNSYLLLHLARQPEVLADLEPVQLNIGNGGDFLTTRIAYKLNLTGPSYTVQSACSTSLVAVHAACESLLSEEADLALAGGVSINVGFRYGYDHADGGMMSPDGVCRPFDARAHGTLFGSGAGLVALRRLEDALADGDHIYAVVRGTAINNDGSFKVGYAAPSVEGQTRVIREALDSAGISADDIGYVEAHGTATPLGDPIEVQALTKAWRPDTARNGFCALGSVKGNVGHLDAAAGIAGFIKTVLALKHRQLPPSLHFERPNPAIDFAQSPFYVNGTLCDWAGGQRRRAAVSAFGVGGTNAHVIVEEAPEVASMPPSFGHQLLPLSAKSASALDAMASALADALEASPELPLADVAYTLARGRQTFTHRRVIVAANRDQAIVDLRAASTTDRWDPDKDRSLAFVFSGQGSQCPNMARGLYESNRDFREAIDEAADALQPTLAFDFREALFPAEGQEDLAAERLRDTAVAQVVLFVVEHGLAKVLMGWGLRPTAMVGHSIGEYVAATLADVFSYDDALHLVAARGRLMSDLPPGAMLSVPLAEAVLAPYLEVGLTVSLINGPDRLVVSGPDGLIDDLAARLRADGVACRRLHTSHAFHSAMMQGAVEPLTERLRSMALGKPCLPFLSNRSGTWITDEEARDPDYWAGHLRLPVRFADNVGELLRTAEVILLEIGPGDMLTRLARRHPDAGSDHRFLSILGPVDRQGDGAEDVLKALGHLWMAGARVDWRRFYAADSRRRVSLPGYPFERERYWIESDGHSVSPSAAPLTKGRAVPDWLYEPVWRRCARPRWAPTDLNVGTRWLILGTGGALDERLIEALTAARQEVVRIRPGSMSTTSIEGETLDPADPSAYTSWVDAQARRGHLPRYVLHLWQVPDGDGFEHLQQQGLFSVLHLIRALEVAAPDHETDLVVVSSGVFAVTATESLCPAKATLAGALPVISQEHPHRRCRHLDVRFGAGSVTPGQVATILGAALDSTRPTLALRGSQCWEPRFERWRGAAVDERSVPVGTLRQGGVYLITGGLEEIGVEQAQYLAVRHGARLALQVDADFPVESRWDAFLAAHETHRVSSQIRAARRLAVQADDLMLLPVDADDGSAMAELPAQVVAHFGALHGLIHNGRRTGERSFRRVVDTDAEACGWQLTPKVHGLRHLAPALARHDLDFCLLNSSMSSLLGGLGTFAYAAANGFLDAFAHEMTRRGEGRWIAVNWEAWRRTQIAGLSPDVARLALESEEGADLLELILNGDGGDGPARLVVSTVDFETRRRAWAGRGRFSADPSQSLLGTDVARGERAARPDLETLYQAPSTDTEKLVADVWERILGLKRIGVLDSFFDLGGDSLVAVQTATQLEKVIGRKIPVVDLYDGLTVGSLAAAIDGLDSEGRSGAHASSSESDRRDRSRGRESQLQQRDRRARRRQPVR